MSAYSDAVLALSPSWYWRFEGASPLEDVVASVDLTASGSPTRVPSIIPCDDGAADSAYSIDGTINTLEVPADTIEFEGTTSFSVVVCFKPNIIDTTFRRLISMSDDASGVFNGFQIYYHSTAGIGWARYNAGTGIGGNSLPNVWNTSIMHMFGMTYDGSNVKAYIDGVLIDTDADTNSLAEWGGTIRFGQGQFGSNGGNIVFDDVAFWDNALDSLDMEDLWTAANDLPEKQSIYMSRPRYVRR